MILICFEYCFLQKLFYNKFVWSYSHTLKRVFILLPRDRWSWLKATSQCLEIRWTKQPLFQVWYILLLKIHITLQGQVCRWSEYSTWQIQFNWNGNTVHTCSKIKGAELYKQVNINCLSFVTYLCFDQINAIQFGLSSSEGCAAV